METPYSVNITPVNTGLWNIAQTEAAARKATELLNDDIEKHHLYFNDKGFHNHISHQILALYGTGATTEVINKGYYHNANYQRPAIRAHPDLIAELRDWEKAKKRLGKEEYYSEWLLFFQHEIEHSGGWQKVLSEYIFKDDERSADILVRMLAGFVHPLIQLMYGMEWNQPAIVAMALAQACTHDDTFRDFFLESEKRANERYNAGAGNGKIDQMPRIAKLLEAVRADPKLRVASLLDEDNNWDGLLARDRVLTQAGERALVVASHVKVLAEPDELAERTAEMYNTAVYEAAAAAIWEDKENGNRQRDPKFDFFIMHHVNVCPIFITLNAQDWISPAAKARLLEWKIRLDLLQYAASGSPELNLTKISRYEPKVKATDAMKDVLPRLHAFVDDGHAIKLFRAVLIAQHISRPYEDCDWLLIKSDLWNKVTHMIADSVEAPGLTWVRNSGFEEAWKDIYFR